jgi:hypothetical protein
MSLWESPLSHTSSLIPTHPTSYVEPELGGEEEEAAGVIIYTPTVHA